MRTAAENFPFAGTLDNRVSLERIFERYVELQLLPDSHQSGVAGEDIFVRECLSVLVLPSDESEVVMAAHRQRELSVAGAP